MGEALDRLTRAARRLSAEPLVPLSVPPPGPVEGEPPSLTPLRRRLGALLAGLADRVEPALGEALARADQAWDQADALRIFDAALTDEVERLRADCDRLRASDDPELAAAGLEAWLTLSAASDLASLLERRLATVMRLQVRAGGPLLDGHRPFFDLAPALREAARGWR